MIERLDPRLLARDSVLGPLGSHGRAVSGGGAGSALVVSPCRATLGEDGSALPWSTVLLSTRNYGPTVFVQQEALKKGCEQVLWLYGPDHQLTEVGTMNIFIFWTHEDGGEPTHDPSQALAAVGGSRVLSGLQVSGVRGAWGGP